MSGVLTCDRVIFRRNLNPLGRGAIHVSIGFERLCRHAPRETERASLAEFLEQGCHDCTNALKRRDATMGHAQVDERARR